MVGFLGSNLLRGDIDLCYPEDCPGCAATVTILDTRTQAEYDAWHIPGAVLIPYTELRDRLDELPRDRPVYAYCRSGFRSCIAYCVLKQERVRRRLLPLRRRHDLPRLPPHAAGRRQGRDADGVPRGGRACPAARRARPPLMRRRPRSSLGRGRMDGRLTQGEGCARRGEAVTWCGDLERDCKPASGARGDRRGRLQVKRRGGVGA